MRTTSLLLTLMMIALLACRREAPLEWSKTPYLNINSPWVDTLLNTMSPAEKIGQLLFLDVQAEDVSPDSVLIWTAQQPLGGLQIKGWEAASFSQYRPQLEQYRTVPLLMGTEQTHLLNKQFAASATVPADPVFQLLAAEDSMRLVAEQLFNQQLQALGIDCQFVPWQHFRHTATAALPTDRLQFASHLPWQQLRGPTDSLYWDSTAQQSLAAIQDRGVAGFYLDSDPHRQQWTPEQLAGLFRQQLNFGGLLMATAAPHNALALLAGSVDMLRVEQDPRPVYQALLNAYYSGVLRAEEIDHRVAKILMAKAWLREQAATKEIEEAPIQYDQASILSGVIGSSGPDTVSTTNSTIALYEHFTADGWRLFNQEIYQRTSVVVNNREQLLPFRDLYRYRFRLVHLGEGSRQALESTFGHYADFAKYYHLADESGRYPRLQITAGKKEICILTLAKPLDVIRDSLLLADLQLLANDREVVILYFGELQGLQAFDERFSILYFPEFTEQTQELAAQALFGGFSPAGKLPVAVNHTFPQGTGSELPIIRLGYTTPEAVGIAPQKLVGIDAIVQSAIDDGAFPGCQVLVAKGGSVIYSKAFGYHDYQRSRPVNEHDVYDVASITKVAATTLAAMKLYEQDKFKPNDKIKDYLPCPGNSKIKNIQLKKLLIHQSGLQPHLPIIPYLLYRDQHNVGCDSFYCKEQRQEYTVEVAEKFYFNKQYYDQIWKDIHYITVGSQRRYRYSDANFVLIQRILERQSGMPLDDWVRQQFYTPLGLRHMTYRPLDRFDRSRIVPTQQDARWRQQLVHGFVHDETAALMGGVGGHAGLFSNAEDLAVIFQMLLNEGHYGGVQYLQPETIKLFTSARHGNHRGFGFDTAHPDSRSAFSLSASQRTFGHTGFTGTCVWADPDHDLLFVFLSNRIHPDIRNKKLFKNKVRERIHQVIYDALDSYQPDWNQRKIAIE